jgi:PKD repeat protein
MRKTVLSIIAILSVHFAYAQLSFIDATDSLRFGTLRSGLPMAVVDMNGDGLDDIVCLHERQFLYIEYQQADTSIFEGVYYGDLGSIQWSMCVADVDTNGYNDIFTGGVQNGLFILKANSNGSDYNTTTISNPSIFLQGSNFVDIDGDGAIDIFAANDFGLALPLKNDGAGNFTPDYSLISTTTIVPSDNSGTNGTVWTDFDNDGDLDLYIAKSESVIDNPTDPRRLNQLFENDGANNYEDIAAQANLQPFGQSWASAFGDIDNDGDLDCFIINHDISNSLYRNNGNGSFTDITSFSNIGAALSSTGLGIQAKFTDFDNDGFLDLLYTSLGMNHAILMNNGNGTFTSLDNNMVFPVTDRIHSATVGDLNDDGFMDIYAGYGFGFNQISNQHDRLFYNNGNDNHYIKILLKGSNLNANGVGARLELFGQWGIQIREVYSGESFGIMSSYTTHFGIGDANSIDSLYVYWPDGNTDRIINPSIDTTYFITEGDFCLPYANFETSGTGLNLTLSGSGDIGITDWTWIINGSVVLDGQEVNYLFPDVGTYTVCLNTTGDCGDSQICKQITVTCPPLNALFSHQADGLDISFEDFSFGDPVNWMWNFGDGNTSTEQSPSHGFDQPGNYFVCLTVSNECGNAGFCEFIPVSCGSVTTAFNTEITDLQVNFIDFSSAGTTSWNWDFGDGVTSSEQNPIHIYDEPGGYEVCLSINGVCGMGNICQQVTVSCTPPEAEFLAFNNELEVSFNDNSANTPTEWQWDFGDGNTSSQEDPVHLYNLPGTYTVCLIASNFCASDTLCRQTIVSCDAPIAGYTYIPNELMYTFIDTSLNDPSSWTWSVDGQNAGQNSTLTYNFPQPGTYEVCLETAGICGVDTACQILDISCSSPIAGFSYFSNNYQATFTDTSSSNPTEWQWLVDGISAGTTATIDINFPDTGTFEVCLIVESVCGTDTSCTNIPITCELPSANFITEIEDLNVTFIDDSSNSPSDWQWTINGQVESDLTSFVYDFPMPGIYEACLIINNECGSDTSCMLLDLSCDAPVSDFNFSANELDVSFSDNSTNSPTEWQWFIDDNLISSENDVVYTFPGSGTFEVCLQSSSICGSDIYCEMIDVICTSPVADYAFTSDGLIGNFSDNTSSNPNQWQWTVDGQVVGNQNNLQYNFLAPDTYEVCLTASNDCDEDTYCSTISVDCADPIAGFMISSNELSVSFTDTSANGPNIWEWKIDDQIVSTDNQFDFDFDTPGTYEVCLFISSICGNDTYCENITVSCQAPDAAFNFSPDQLSASFTDHSTNMPEQWQWTINGQVVSSQNDFDYDFPLPGTYEVCLSVSSICGNDIVCEQITLSCTAPVANFTFNTTNLSANFTDASSNAPDQWQWTVDGQNVSTQSDFDYTFPADGTYEVCLNSSSICGSDTDCQQVTVSCINPVAAYDTDIDGLSGQFTDNSTGLPSSWNWTVNGSLVGNTPMLSYDFPINGNYEICLEVSNDCGSQQSCQNIAINCNASIAGFDNTVDDLSVSFISTSSDNTVNWQWSFGDGNGSTSPNPQYTYPAPGNYNVCLTVSNTCGDENQICQFVNVDCTPALSTFTNSSNLLTTSFTDLTVGNTTSWLWEFGDGNTSTQQNPQHLYASAGNYTVCLTTTSVCGSSQSCQPISIVCPVPSAGFELEADGLNIVLTDTSLNNPSQWNWSFGDGNFSNLPNPTYTFSAPGQYIVCLTTSSICGTNQTCKQIELSCDAPNAAYSYEENELMISFEDQSNNSPTGWSWDFGDGSTSSLADPIYSYSLPGTYNVCLTASSICGSTTTCQSVSVTCTAPQATFSSNANGLTYDFTDLSTDSPTSWQWTFGDGSASNAQHPTHTYTNPGSYQVCLEASSICGSNTACQTIMVDCSAPQAAFTFDGMSLNYNFMDMSTGDVSSWLWDFGDGNTSIQPNPLHNYSIPGNYTVCLESSSVCGSTQTCQDISVSCLAPETDFDFAQNELVFNFVDQSTSSPTEWLWDFGDGNTSSLPNPEHTYAEPGNYVVCLLSSSVCGSDQFCQVLEVTCTAPQANFVIDTDELTINFTDITTNNPETWFWTFGNGGSSTEQNPQHTYSIPGSYLVCLNVTSVCGNTQRCETINVSCAAPIAGFMSSSSELAVTFQDTSLANSADITTWQWSFGDGNFASVPNPLHMYDEPGVYNVCLTVNSLCGMATVCQNVAITVNSDNSIDQSSLDLKVFPNPAKDYCTFQLLGDVTSDYDWYLLSRGCLKSK